MWELIRSLLPPMAGTGRPRVDDRMVIMEFFMFLLPAAVGWICQLSMAYKTAWDRFKRYYLMP
ncbi:MAG: hypothetical protein QXH24_06550 [Candidatus Bathyarchaeia archaeon]